MIANTFRSMMNVWFFAILLYILIMFYFNTNAAYLGTHLRDIFVNGAQGDVRMKLNETHTFDE